MKKQILIFTGILIFSLSILLSLNTKANAVFDGNNIMSDSVFDNVGSMSEIDIQTFLNQFPNSCLKNLQAPYPNHYFSYGANVSAAKVVKRASDLWQINPQVILATLQKESSVVTGTASYGCAYLNTSMGFNCPDSGGCPVDPANAGFSQQVTKGSWLLKAAKERSLGNINWDPPEDPDDDRNYYYSGPMTQGYRQRRYDAPIQYFDGYHQIDGQTVHIDSGATASFYFYTPHFPGNQNFVNIFEGWFGSTNGDLVRTVNNATVYLVSGTNKHPISDINLLQDYSRLGPIRYVNDQFVNSLTTGSILGRMVGATGGTLYFVNANIKLPFTSCASVANYGFTCASVIYLTDAQLNRLSNGPHITPLIKSASNGTVYYMSNGKKRPIPSWRDLVSLNIPISINVFSNYVITSYQTGSLLIGPGGFLKTSSSETVYIVKSLTELFPITNFIYPQEFGLNSNIYTISNSDLQSYFIQSVLKNKIKCNSMLYIGTLGKAYPISTGLLDYYGFNNSDFLEGGGVCNNIQISQTQVNKYIRTSNGTIYYIDNGQKRAFTSYSSYISNGGNSGNTLDVSNFFVSTIPSGPNM